MKTTINLLPPEKKQEMQSAFVFAYVQSLLVVVLLLTCIVSGTLVSTRLMLMNTLSGLSSSAGPDTDEFTSVSQDIRDINAYIDSLEKLQKNRVAWSSVIDEIVDLLPTGVTLSRITLNPEGKIVLTGVAVHRDDVLQLENQLKNSGSFEDVKSPLSNILQRDDVKFEFEFQYAPLAVEEPDEKTN